MITAEMLQQKVIDIFGDDIANPVHHPQTFNYQCKIALATLQREQACQANGKSDSVESETRSEPETSGSDDSAQTSGVSEQQSETPSEPQTTANSAAATCAETPDASGAT